MRPAKLVNHSVRSFQEINYKGIFVILKIIKPIIAFNPQYFTMKEHFEKIFFVNCFVYLSFVYSISSFSCLFIVCSHSYRKIPYMKFAQAKFFDDLVSMFLLDNFRWIYLALSTEMRLRSWAFCISIDRGVSHSRLKTWNRPFAPVGHVIDNFLTFCYSFICSRKVRHVANFCYTPFDNITVYRNKQKGVKR